MHAPEGCAHAGTLFDKGDAAVKIGAAHKDVVEHGRDLGFCRARRAARQRGDGEGDELAAGKHRSGDRAQETGPGAGTISRFPLPAWDPTLKHGVLRLRSAWHASA